MRQRCWPRFLRFSGSLSREVLSPVAAPASPNEISLRFAHLGSQFEISCTLTIERSLGNPPRPPLGRSSRRDLRLFRSQRFRFRSRHFRSRHFRSRFQHDRFQFEVGITLRCPKTRAVCEANCCFAPPYSISPNSLERCHHLWSARMVTALELVAMRECLFLRRRAIFLGFWDFLGHIDAHRELSIDSERVRSSQSRWPLALERRSQPNSHFEFCSSSAWEHANGARHLRLRFTDQDCHLVVVSRSERGRLNRAQ